MKREDFKKITEEHIESCEKIINNSGSCKNILCLFCPFETGNSIDLTSCENKYRSHDADREYVDTVLTKSAREFLKICERTGVVIGEGTVAEDKIKSPNHYKLEGLGIESIDIIKSRLGKDGFKAFCVGNVIKYILRAEKKNGLEDYKKSRQYLDWVIEEAENKI